MLSINSLPGPSGRVLSVMLAAAVALAVAPSVAHAHGRLVASNPGVGSRVATAPRELRLTFSEKIELAVSRVQLLGPDGNAIALAKMSAAAADSGRTAIASISTPLAQGAYTVVWQLVGRDGHPIRGRFTFTVGGGTVAPTAGGASDSAAHPGHGAHPVAPAPRVPAKPATGVPPRTGGHR